jgi:RimJ/RimL family protein N-acetyltransferase
MTLSEEVLAQTRRERSIPVLETERLTLRAPRHEDVKAIAVLANDRRIAANTARIPHPYGVADAEQFIAAVNRRDGEVCFVMVLDGKTDRRLRRRSARGFARAWVLARRVLLGPRLHDRSGARGDRVRVSAISNMSPLQAGARVSNPASRRVLEKCAFQWTGVRLTRIRAINSAAPVDRFRLDRGLWLSLKAWGRVRRVA